MFAKFDDYKSKYLKYKTKYIEFKKKLNSKQFGSGNQWIYSDTKALIPNSYEIEKEYEKYVLDKKNNCNSKMNLIFISITNAIYQGKPIEQIYKKDLIIPNSSLSNVLSFLGPFDLNELQTVNSHFSLKLWF